MRQFRKTTIKEVAAEAGVSTTTVSLFVSGRETVCSPETAERIRQTVARLNYTPSSLTRGLRRSASTTIGVCLPNPLNANLTYGALFFESLWRGVMHEADRENYSLLYYPLSVRDGSRWETFLDGRVDGLLLHDHQNERAAHLASAGMPTVLLTRSVALPDGCGAACADEAQVTDLALSHLWEAGHRRIAHVAGPVGALAPGMIPRPAAPTALWQDDVSIQRLEAYTAWMKAHQAWDASLVAYAQAWSAPQAAEMLSEWLGAASPPTAVFCANDVQALDVVAAARERGLRIPEDLSVVGVDNSALARDSDPPLTSVDIQVEEVGREAVRALLRLMRGEPLDRCRTSLPLGQLVVRSSITSFTDK